MLTFFRRIRACGCFCSAFTLAMLGASHAVASDVNLEWSHPRPQGNTLTSVAYGEGLFVTVGEATTLLWSEDGESWTAAQAPLFDYLFQVIHTEEAFLAVGMKHLLRSLDGKSWTVIYDGSDLPNQRLDRVAVAADGRIVIGGTTLGPSHDRSITMITADSPNGEWLSTIVPDAEGLVRDIAYGDGKFVTLTRTISHQPGALHSSDGSTWIPATHPPTTVLDSVAFAWGKFWAVGPSGHLWTSASGAEWTQADALSPRRLHQIAFNGERLTAFGPGETADSMLELSSSDGLVWNETVHDGTANFSSVVNLGSRYVGVGAGGTMATTTDPAAWTMVSNRVSSGSLSAVAFGHGRYVAVGGEPPEFERFSWWPGATGGTRSILVSDDAEEWTPATISPGAEPLYAITFAKDVFVAVGRGGAIETSADGLSWTPRSAPVAQHLFDVIHDGARFVAVGESGTIIHSADGETWTSVSTSLPYSLTSVTWSGSTYVASTLWGSMVVSSNLSQWQESYLGDSNVSPHSVAFNDGLFVAAGGTREDGGYFDPAKGRLFTSPDGENWTPVQGEFLTHFRRVIPYLGGFLAVAGSQFEGGQVFISSDGLQWSETPDGFVGPPLWGAALVNGHVIVVGDNASILQIGTAGAIPSILQQPRQLPVMPGGLAQFSIVAEGGNEPLQYQWFRGEEELVGNERTSGVHSPTLEIENAVAEDAGLYRVTVTSGDVVLQSREVSLSVVPHLTVDRNFNSFTPGWQKTAFATIQPAINAVGAAPMFVRVEPGQYFESLVFDGKPVVLTSADPNSPYQYSISSGPAGGPTVTFADGEDSRTVLRGFLLRQGSGRNNGDGSPIVLIRGAAPVIENNFIQGNTAQAAGGGIRIEDPSPNSDFPMIRRNHIASNNAEQGAGIAVLNASANIENNVIHENGLNSPQSLAGGGIYVSAPAGRHVAIINNTIVANRATQGGGIFVEGEATVALANSIVAFQNGGGGLARHPSRTEPVSVRYSNFWQNTDGNWINLPDLTGHDGNLTFDPLFVGQGLLLASLSGTWDTGENWTQYDTHSPLIDAGDPASDFSLESPPNGGRINMGAYGGTESASRSIDLPLLSTLSAEDGTHFLVRNGTLDSPLPIAITSTGTAFLDRDFRTIPSPLMIPAGKTLIPFRITAIPGTLLDGQPSATLEVNSHPSYLLQTPAAFFFPIPLLPYNEWLKEELPAAWHSSSDRTDPQNDPDGQGVPNLLRFAFRMTSSATDRGNLPRTEIRQIETGETSNPYLSLTYVQLPPSSGLHYILEGSSDLQNWTVIDDPEILESEPIPDAERVTVRDENPLSSGSTRFLRMRVEFAE